MSCRARAREVFLNTRFSGYLMSCRARAREVTN